MCWVCKTGMYQWMNDNVIYCITKSHELVKQSSQSVLLFFVLIQNLTIWVTARIQKKKIFLFSVGSSAIVVKGCCFTTSICYLFNVLFIVLRRKWTFFHDFSHLCNIVQDFWPGERRIQRTLSLVAAYVQNQKFNQNKVLF